MRNKILKNYINDFLISQNSLLEKYNINEIKYADPSEWPDESDSDILWGDLIDILNAKIKSKSHINKAKLIFRAIGASSIETGIDIGIKNADSYISSTNSLCKSILSVFKNSEPVSSEIVSSKAISSINSKLKKVIKSYSNSIEDSLSKILLKLYKSKSDSDLIRKLSIDKKVSEIIDDEVERDFLMWLSDKIVNDNTIKSFSINKYSINDLLQKYLSEEYEDRTVTGF